MAINFTQKTWKDYPDTSTPIMAEDLNRIESAVSTIADELQTANDVCKTATRFILNGISALHPEYERSYYTVTATPATTLIPDGGVPYWTIDKPESGFEAGYDGLLITVDSLLLPPAQYSVTDSKTQIIIEFHTSFTNGQTLNFILYQQALQNLAVVNVTDTTDLNNVTDTGIYSLQNLSAITNAPDGVSLGCVYVTKLPLDGTSGARYEQILIGGSINISKHKVYIRHGQGDDMGINWSSWVEILDTTDLSDYVKNTDFATTSSPGIMTAADKTKLNGIALGANKTVVDSALSSTSTNPVQNKVINTALSNKSDTDHTHSQYYSSDDDTSGLIRNPSAALGASGHYWTMADKVVEVYIQGAFKPTATGNTTITTLPFSFDYSRAFICHDTTHNVPLEASVSTDGKLSINFKSTDTQSIVLHETFICK